MHRRLASLLFLTLAGCASSDRTVNKPLATAAHVSVVPIKVPPSMSVDAVRGTLRAAEESLRRFARRWDWETYAERPFYRSVEIFDDKGAFDARMRELGHMPAGTKLPPTYTAALEEEVLIAVSPELYAAAFPDGVEPGAYEKLFTHELAHRLHVRLVDDREDEMGPIWFFEGFAVLAAEQFSLDPVAADHDALWQTFRLTERGSYRTYGRAMRELVRRTSLPALVAHARRADLLDWLATIVPP